MIKLKSISKATTYLATSTYWLSTILYPSTVLAGVGEFNLENATITSINEAYNANLINSQQLVQLYLNRIDAYELMLGPASSYVLIRLIYN